MKQESLLVVIEQGEKMRKKKLVEVRSEIYVRKINKSDIVEGKEVMRDKYQKKGKNE